MRTLAAPFLLGFVAFASYSLKTNYASPSEASPPQGTASKPSSGERLKPGSSPGREPNNEAKQPCISLQDDALQCAIDRFFGKPGPHPVRFDLGKNKSAIRFVIATVPDPVHTDLALLFDRFVEAISQGAQEAGYNFDHAVLPWPTPREFSEETKEDDSKRPSLRLSKLERENTPGLLIFRRASALEDASQRQLFVILVGENPTAGIHKEQFQRALEIVRKNSTQSPLRIDIIGPTFSGSLYSLRVLEKLAKGKPKFRIRSGTVMSGTAIDAFRKDPLNRDFLSFKDTDTYLIDRFVAFVRNNGLEGYKEEGIALISEDETALGSLSTDESGNGHHNLLRIYFPRGISQLRTAYQDDPVLSSGADTTNAPHSRLKLSLDSTGSDDDSVPTYAGRQTAISQEAVMMGIVTLLRVHHHQFLILRATDPKDLLFLTRFFRTNFPEDRIITMGADQLFPRDINDTVFRGVLSLTNYPLLPSQLTDFDSPRPHRVFASTDCAGLFNATLAILKEAEKPDKKDNDKENNKGSRDRTKEELPEAQYFEYTFPVFDKQQTPAPRPLAWLTVVGDDGYWPLATLPEPQETCARQSVKLRGQLCTFLSWIPGVRKCETCPALSCPTVCCRRDKPSLLRPASPIFPRQISLRPSLFNQLFIAGLLVFSAAFIYLTWLGDFKSRSMLHQQFAMLTDKTRGNLLGMVSVLLTGAFVLLGSPFSGDNRWPPTLVIAGAVAVAVSTVLNLWARGQSRTAIVVGLSSAIVGSPLVWLTRPHHSIRESILLYRMAWLQSGVSPTIPLLLACAALFSWAWFNLKLRSLFDLRRPLLPRGNPVLPGDDEHDTDEYTHVLTRSPLFWGVVVLVIAVIVIQDIDPLSVDGTNFDDLYRVFFISGTLLIANSMFTAWCTWKKCRALLWHLDRTPLRWAFRRIDGFSWKRLWGVAGGDLMGAYKPLSRSLEALVHLRASLGAGHLKDQLAYMQSRARLVDGDLKQLRGTFANSTKSTSASHLRQLHDDLVYRMHTLQKNLAVTCSLVWLAVLEKVWQDDVRFVTTGQLVSSQSPDKLEKRASESSASGDESGETCSGNETQSTRLAEEFISLTYLNFIHRVLLRLRWLLLAATSAYVLLLFSVKLYPFEPHGHIDGLLILLFLGMASVVYTIYAQMHRDATLSHLTKTTPGELGADFWIRLIGIGAVPIFSLVATQVPALNRFFFLWLKPIIDAVHRS